MSIPTCAVRTVVLDSVGGRPLAGAIVSARLSSYEIYQGFVVPQDIEVTSAVDGSVVLPLFPNELGSASSFYDVKIIAPNGKTLRTVAVVPNQDMAELSEISEVPPYDGKPDGAATIAQVQGLKAQTQQLRDQAQTAAGDADGNANATMGYRDEANAAKNATIAARDVVLPAVDQATNAAALAVPAAATAVEARDIILGSQISGTVGFPNAGAMVLTYPERTVALVGSDPDPTKNTWYIKVGASGAGSWVPVLSLLLAALTATSLTVAGVTFNAQTIAGYLRASVDAYGRLQRGTRSDGTEYIDKVLSRVLAADSATISIVTLQRMVIGPVSTAVESWAGRSRAVTDSYGRLLRWEQTDGSFGISKLRDNTGALVYPQIAAAKTTADAALLAAATGGASAFRQAMLSAQSKWGGYPKPSLITPPTLTLTGGNPSAPAGTTLAAWNSSGKWRTTGGFTSQFGANSFQQILCSSPNGNAGGFTRAGGTAVETVHTGTCLWVRLRGAGGALRVLVGDATGKNYAYVSKAFLTPAADGAAYLLQIDFAGVSAKRSIMIEGNGALQLGGMYVLNGETITAPDGTKPLVCCMGSSITEMDNSWARWLGYLLGANVFNVGVGSSGIVNPGVSPKVKQIDRSNDFTTGAFLLGIEEAGINDSGDQFYSAPTYAAVMGEFATQYRRVLDAWFTAHPNAPFIGWGPFWPNDAPTANVYRIRDAKQRVCSEYPLAAFIDTLTPGNLIKGNPINGTYPATDYFAPYVASPPSDTTHPIEVGSEFIGQTLFPQIDRLIRTRF